MSRKWAKSVVATYGSVNPNRLMHYLLTVVIIINGRENKFTSAIIITTAAHVVDLMDVKISLRLQSL